MRVWLTISVLCAHTLKKSTMADTNDGTGAQNGDDTPNSFASAVAELNEVTDPALSGVNRANNDEDNTPLGVR